ncbi:MAG: hypothetical protein GTO53_06965 [Planctomycetales bacterium]|nr:hypothetical protein [Planctomycetales bacterium]NIM08876.1 hypothetical protein [Planctomycetales bacterium]NIN08336.1 hypothetical protein [Planctomycetales bacterium]NIN77464.1 hypothetical protein [Planctomycetales bacterium]NIO34636.1 hypothetical protein [Planctomycetales bacterium]
MHERSVVRALLKQVQQLQSERCAERVVAVRVSVGAFCGVEADLFQTAFDQLVDESPICGARLELSQVPLEACCDSCQREFPVVNFRFICPHCEGDQIRVVRGEGLVLESVTLE